MNRYWNFVVATVLMAAVAIGSAFAEPSKNFKVFLCFGQSNMSGGAGVTPQSEDTKTNPRIFTLAFGSCQGWTDNNWGLAKEPLHCGDNVGAMGPAFAFGKAMTDSLPDDTIGLIPCGLYSRPIEIFMKNGNNMGSGGPIPGWDQKGTNVYTWMLNKCKKAQERGVFTGIILHQGESNSGQQDWCTKVKTIYDDLKEDLSLDHDFPLVAGELLYSGCCGGHNDIIKNIPTTLPLGYVASAQGLSGGGSLPQYHFNQAGYRTMGQRMAVEMMKGIHEVEKVKATQPTPRHRIISATTATTQNTAAAVYTLNGKLISNSTGLASKTRSAMRPGNMYIVVNKATGTSAKLMMAPTVR